MDLKQEMAWRGHRCWWMGGAEMPEDEHTIMYDSASNTYVYNWNCLLLHVLFCKTLERNLLHLRYETSRCTSSHNWHRKCCDNSVFVTYTYAWRHRHYIIAGSRRTSVYLLDNLSYTISWESVCSCMCHWTDAGFAMNFRNVNIHDYRCW